METTISNDEASVDILEVNKNLSKNANEELEIIADKNTVVNINEEHVNAGSRQYNRHNYWVAFFGTQPQNPPEQANQSIWSYFKGYTPSVPEKPPLDYKPETRNSFVKRVMSIVLIMIIVTALFVAFVLMTPDVKMFFASIGWILLLPAMALLMIVNYGMVCYPCTRQLPCNIFFLFLATVAMSVISAKITAHFKTEVILYALIATASAVFVCVLLACSKFDFTKYMLFVIVISTALTVVIMIIIIVKITTGMAMKPLMISVLIVSTLLECIFLTIQLQSILGGRAVELNESDYALGAYMIYTSIVNIFLNMASGINLISE